MRKQVYHGVYQSSSIITADRLCLVAFMYQVDHLMLQISQPIRITPKLRDLYLIFLQIVNRKSSSRYDTDQSHTSAVTMQYANKHLNGDVWCVSLVVQS